jgi:hypothetical protein
MWKISQKYTGNMDIAAIAMGSGDFNNGILDANGMLL